MLTMYVISISLLVIISDYTIFMTRIVVEDIRKEYSDSINENKLLVDNFITDNEAEMDGIRIKIEELEKPRGI